MFKDLVTKVRMIGRNIYYGYCIGIANKFITDNRHKWTDGTIVVSNAVVSGATFVRTSVAGACLYRFDAVADYPEIQVIFINRKLAKNKPLMDALLLHEKAHLELGHLDVCENGRLMDAQKEIEADAVVAQNGLGDILRKHLEVSLTKIYFGGELHLKNLIEQRIAALEGYNEPIINS